MWWASSSHLQPDGLFLLSVPAGVLHPDPDGVPPLLHVGVGGGVDGPPLGVGLAVPVKIPAVLVALLGRVRELGGKLHLLPDLDLPAGLQKVPGHLSWPVYKYLCQ